MKQEIFKRLSNVALRGLTMGSRFFLLFVLARLLEPAELGLFGLMLATVSFGILVIGADYYIYSQRELLARPPEQWSFVIQHQIKAQVILYGVLLPLHLFIFFFGFLDWQYAAWFFVLLVAEHVSQEINRLLIVMHKQLIASWVLFIRWGSWVLVIVPVMYFLPEMRSLNTLYAAWLAGDLFAIFIGIAAIQKVLPNWKKSATDIKWLKQGFKVGGLFLLSTLCFKGLLTFDRYAVEILSSAEILGVYVFYIGLIVGLYAFLDPAVFSFIYPKMLQSYQMQDKQNYQKVYKELVILTVSISVVLAIVIWGVAPYIINWIGKPIYTEYMGDFRILILVGFVFALGHIPHYALYAMKGDKWIFLAHISSLIVFFFILWGVLFENGIQAVGVALLAAFSWMALIKTVGYIYTKQHSTLLNA